MSATGDLPPSLEFIAARICASHQASSPTRMPCAACTQEVDSLATEARRDAAEQIAQAIEKMQTFAHGENPQSRAHMLGYETARRIAARIARKEASC